MNKEPKMKDNYFLKEMLRPVEREVVIDGQKILADMCSPEENLNDLDKFNTMVYLNGCLLLKHEYTFTDTDIILSDAIETKANDTVIIRPFKKSESKRCYLRVEGKPVPNRTKSGTGGYYKPKPVIAYKKLIESHVAEYCWKHKDFKPFEGATKMTLYIYMPIPKSWSKKKRMEAMVGLHHTSRPDSTNITKLVEDAISYDKWSGAYYLVADDKLICEHQIYKRYSTSPGVEIILEEI